MVLMLVGSQVANFFGTCSGGKKECRQIGELGVLVGISVRLGLLQIYVFRFLRVYVMVIRHTIRLADHEVSLCRAKHSRLQP